MATFKPTIFKDRQRADGTWKVFIRFNHENKTRYMPTTMYVTKKDLSAKMEIRNAAIKARADELIVEYRKRLFALNIETAPMPIDAIVERLKGKKGEKALSFSDYAEQWIAKAKQKGKGNYKTALNAMRRFLGREYITTEDITVATLKRFESWLDGKPRAQSLYTSAIMKMFADMRDDFNDEDNDVIVIKHSLRKYSPPRQNVARKRAIPTEKIRAIYALPYQGKHSNGQRLNRRDLARDCFLLSFCLLGTNAADLYNATECDGHTLIYERTKTKDRRNDRARMEITIPDIIRPLMEKYKGRERVFSFHRRFATASAFTSALNKGMKEVGKEIGEEGLQFYAARHSMATIAVNEAGIDMWTVNAMLNHTDRDMRVTELYIKKDFTPINNANAKLLAYVFGER